jgi:putative restriction endonuclease
VLPPSDWAKTGIQQGKTYDLQTGEGLRIWEECLERAKSFEHWNVDAAAELVPADAPRFGREILVRPRLGQGLFSLAVREAYDGACAVTGEHSAPVLDAAHIRPYAEGGEHRVDNGLLLRRDLHRLFDFGYVTVTPDYVFRVGERLRDEFKNGRSYYGLHGAVISIPSHDAWRPNRELLDWHTRDRFKG